MFTNLHTHTSFSDGSSLPEEYIHEAHKQGVTILGFSDHSPIPIPNSFAIPENGLTAYCEAISRLKKKDFSEQPANPNIQVLLGLEYDYIPKLSIPVVDLRNRFPFDFIIGSVHLVKNDFNDQVWFIDGPSVSTYDSGLQHIFQGNVRKAITAYWRQLQEMIMNQKPDIIGHLDKIKMHNQERFFRENEPWYVALTTETLHLIKETGAVIEVNTRGIYKKRSKTLFPGPDILKEILLLNIPITLTSDAHKPAELTRYFPEAITILQHIGFRTQWVLTRSGWLETGL